MVHGRKLMIWAITATALDGCSPRPIAHAQVTCQMTTPAHDYLDLLASARQRNQPYIAPTAEERERFGRAARSLLDDLAAGRDLAPIQEEFARLELELAWTALGGHRAVAIVEQPDHRRGRGFYVVRCGAVTAPDVIQVPHSFHDEGTLPIGSAVAERGAWALFVNTVHRYPQGVPQAASDGVDDGGSPQDLAHRSDTIWQAMTEALLDRWRDLTVIQIHGFADGADPGHRDALAIISAGKVTHGAERVAQVTGRLRALFDPGLILQYPDSTRVLGATKNAQGAMFRARGAGALVHVELSRTLRQRLAHDGELLGRFAEALTRVGPTR